MEDKTQRTKSMTLTKDDELNSYLMLSVAILVFIAIALTGCQQPKNPILRNKTQDPMAVSQNFSGSFNANFTPQMDVVFVVDNSTSMKNDQNAVSSVIEHFVNAISGNGTVDIHLGVTSVWDTKSFSNPEAIKEFSIGELWPLKNSKGDFLEGSPRFATRDTEKLLDVISSTLKIGTLNTGNPTWGPEFEESFTPVAAALENPMNEGFFRGDESQLVIIFLTDADDNSDMTASQLQRILSDFKGNDDLISTYGFISPSNTSCAKDPGINKQFNDPEKIEDFLALTNGDVLNICTATNKKSKAVFAKQIKEIGEELKRKVAKKIIHLSAVPEYSEDEELRLKVFYGSQEIPNDAATGWSFGREDTYGIGNTIIISGDYQPEKEEKGATIRIEYTSVKMNNTKNGLATKQ